MSAFVDAYQHADTPRFLWTLMEESLDEPHTTIAHKAMPTWEQHLAFLERRTYRALLLIVDRVPGSDLIENVGYVGVTQDNEIGIRIRKGFRGKGYGQEAIGHVLDVLRPRPGAGIAPNRFIANINPRNGPSIGLFTQMGFTLHHATHEALVYASPPYPKEENNHGESQPEEGSRTA